MLNIEAERIVAGLSAGLSRTEDAVGRAYTIAVHQIGDRSEVALLLSRALDHMHSQRVALDELRRLR